MDKDFKKIINHFDDLFSKYGYSDKSIGWGKKRKKLRYHILCEHFDLSGKSILDFGCGFGDLYMFLKKSYADFEYTGIDINTNFIKEAKNQYYLKK